MRGDLRAKTTDFYVNVKSYRGRPELAMQGQFACGFVSKLYLGSIGVGCRVAFVSVEFFGVIIRCLRQVC